MLDAGLTLEADRLGLVEKLKRSRPEDWAPADLAAYQAGMNPDVGGVPLKLVYGSDFAYREADEHLGVHYDNVGLRPSLARGGLSNVWGAAMMPYLERDLRNGRSSLPRWRHITQAVLAVHRTVRLPRLIWRSCSRFTPATSPTCVPAGNASNCWRPWSATGTALAARGIHFGRSRLAVRGNLPPADGGCVYCRLCMYGCPYGYIYIFGRHADAVAAILRTSATSPESL